MAKFTCETKEGAVLMMPEGAYYEKLTNRTKLEDYLVLHAPNLYKYVNNTLSRRFRNGELSVVFSCRKTTAWGITTFQNTAARGSNTTKMHFLRKEHDISPSAGSRYKWNCGGSVHAKVGPEDNNELGVNRDEITSLRNQCLFVRTLKIKLADEVWKRTFPTKSVAIGSSSDDISSAIPSLSTTLSPTPTGSSGFGGGEAPPTSLSERDAASDSNTSENTSGDEEYNERPHHSSVSGLAALTVIY